MDLSPLSSILFFKSLIFSAQLVNGLGEIPGMTVRPVDVFSSCSIFFSKSRILFPKSLNDLEGACSAVTGGAEVFVKLDDTYGLLAVSCPLLSDLPPEDSPGCLPSRPNSEQML